MTSKTAIAILSHPECTLHSGGDHHPERCERVEVIDAALRAYPFQQPLQFLTPFQATKDQLARAHDPAYVDWLYVIAPKEGMLGIDEDTWMNPHTLAAALYAAGAVIMAVDW